MNKPCNLIYGDTFLTKGIKKDMNGNLCKQQHQKLKLQNRLYIIQTLRGIDFHPDFL